MAERLINGARLVEGKSSRFQPKEGINTHCPFCLVKTAAYDIHKYGRNRIRQLYHIIPLKQGGSPDAPKNKTYVCTQCFDIVHDKTPEEVCMMIDMVMGGTRGIKGARLVTNLLDDRRDTMREQAGIMAEKVVKGILGALK